MLPWPSLHNDSISVEWGNEAENSATDKCMCNTFVQHLISSNIFRQEHSTGDYYTID